jgi:lysophospholipase L1-like esterase
MKQKYLRQMCLFLTMLAAVSAVFAEEKPPVLKLTSPWQVQATLSVSDTSSEATPLTATLDVSPPSIVAVRAEKYNSLSPFNPNVGGWAKGLRLNGLRAEECTCRYLLDPTSLKVFADPQRARKCEQGKDFAADLEWATLGRLPGGQIGEKQPVYIDYDYAPLRIDSIVLTSQKQIVLRQGEPHVATPLPPSLGEGERRLANVFLDGRMAKLEPKNLFPILETSYPEPPKLSPSPAERFLPKTLKKLREGGHVRILAWGDSVTQCVYLPDDQRWQGQFVAQLRQKYPKAQIELISRGWGGRTTASFLAEPPGSPHNFQEKVLNVKPDLIVSEFVNDAGIPKKQAEEIYARLLGDFKAIGAEWIILTPHYVRPDWMGLTSQHEVDADPRPYVAMLRRFAPKHNIALADASLRWGRLWRQGIPYNTLHINAINHPNAAGMKMFADSLMELFP